jgi:hypothetical protein
MLCSITEDNLLLNVLLLVCLALLSREYIFLGKTVLLILAFFDAGDGMETAKYYIPGYST